MQVLVTGGAGFIGSHLVERLVRDGHSVTVLDDLSTGKRENIPAGVDLVEDDVADATIVQPLAWKADAVFHLAAIASVQVCEEQPDIASRTNVTGTEVIFATAAAKKIPVVYASSAAVYGDNPNLPLDEHEKLQPLGNYGWHKLANEQTAKKYGDNVASVGLRFFNVYGPRQDPRSPYSGVISKFAANLQAGQPLTFFGDGEQTRDFIYVGDIVSLLLKAHAAAKGAAVYNGCTGQEINLKGLAQIMGEVMHKQVVPEHAVARKGDIRHSLGNPALAKEQLGFASAVSLHEGLAALAASYA